MVIFNVGKKYLGTYSVSGFICTMQGCSGQDSLEIRPRIGVNYAFISTRNLLFIELKENKRVRMS